MKILITLIFCFFTYNLSFLETNPIQMDILIEEWSMFWLISFLTNLLFATQIFLVLTVVILMWFLLDMSPYQTEKSISHITKGHL